MFSLKKNHWSKIDFLNNKENDQLTFKLKLPGPNLAITLKQVFKIQTMN